MILTSSCQNNRKNGFSELRELSDYKLTDFVPTLENPLIIGHNSVYCAALLYAWDEVRKSLNNSIIVDSTKSDLFLLNQSTTFEDALDPNDYNSSVSTSNNRIKVSVNFKKSLQFVNDFDKNYDDFIFKNQAVKSFVSYGKNEQIEILYYKNDFDFIIKIHTKAIDSEMILFKTTRKHQSLIQYVSGIDDMIRIGCIEKRDEHLKSNYILNKDDKVIIPELDFNIKTNYPRLENNTVYSNYGYFKLDKIDQKTALKLNEHGMELEGEYVVSISLLSLDEECPIKVKNLIFDKPFLIVLRKTRTINPYFCLWIDNTELMIKK